VDQPKLAPDDIFCAAIELASPAERAAYLDQVCGYDLDTRRRVERLLEAHSQAGSFLAARPAVVAATTDLPAESSGTTIGPYKLLQEIGTGGMGVVWMAEQTRPVQRKVALKIIKAGMDSRQVLARFEAERQALALMDHPNIAKVLDGGATAAGRPFFVMELVKGQPITQYCDEHRLTPRQRLELFVSVCQAIQHAHQKGIVHRDIKPSNVLVAPYDGKPVVKIIDFGVAKATGQRLTEKTLFTELGAVVGTLEYMSPEQAELNNQDIDTRSDIYALGVLLYELLTGSTPLTRQQLKQAAFGEKLRMIREEEPTRPSMRLSTTEELPSVAANRGLEPKKLSDLVRGELDWIVMKALEKDRNRRYETASALAADVERYLHDEPVLACPPSARYRLGKFVRRNRISLAVTGLTLLFLAMLTAGGGWVLRDRAARQAKVANDLELALDQAELFPGQGKRAAAMAAIERADLLVEETAVDPVRSERLAAVKKRLADETRDQEFLDDFGDIRLRAQSQFTIETNLFNPAAAFPEFRGALNRFEIRVGVMKPSEVADYVRGRPEEVRRNVLAALDECLRWAPKDDGPLGTWLLAALAAADDDAWRVQARKAVAAKDWRALEQLARDADVAKQPPNMLLFVAGSLPPPMRDTRLELLRRVQRANPADLWANYTLGNALVDKRQPAEAIRYFTAAVALRPKNPALFLNRGEALRLAGEADAAIGDFRQGLALNPQLIRLRIGLAAALQDKRQLDEALAECREVIRLDKSLPDAHNLLGAILLDKGKLDESIDEFRTAVKLAIQPRWVDPKAHHNLGIALIMRGQAAEAIAPLSAAVQLDPEYLTAWDTRGRAYRRLGQDDKALADFERIQELAPTNAYGYSAAAWLLASCREVKLRDPARAVVLARKAVQLGPQVASSWNALGVAQYRAGDYRAAILALDRCLQLDRGDAAQLFFLAMAHGKLGHSAEARTYYGRGLSWMNQFKEQLEKEKAIAEDLRRFQGEAETVLSALKKA
jgi:serine/threonine protein kinase/Flp pilus assembly protein TadD